MTRTALVTGATGFVGLNLVRELLDRDFTVHALHRPSSDLTYLTALSRGRVTRRIADITDEAALRRVVPEDLDAVFHVAASTNMWSRRNLTQTRINVHGTRLVARIAREKGARRLVHTSSIAAFGVHDAPITEETPSNARRSWINYLRTKALAEDEVRRVIDEGLDAVILNPANIIGPYDLSSWSAMFYLVHSGKLPRIPPGRGSFCHVRDVVAAHVDALDRGRRGANYLLGGADASYADVIRVIGRLTGRPVPERASPALLLRAVARLATWHAALRGRRPRFTPEQAALVCGDMICRSDRAVRELGYRTSPLQTMLQDCHRWMVDEGRLR